MARRPPRRDHKFLKTHDEYGGYRSKEQAAEANAKASVDRSEAMLDTMLELRQQLSDVQEQIRELQAAATRKKGLFG